METNVAFHTDNITRTYAMTFRETLLSDHLYLGLQAAFKRGRYIFNSESFFSGIGQESFTGRCWFTRIPRLHRDPADESEPLAREYQASGIFQKDI